MNFHIKDQGASFDREELQSIQVQQLRTLHCYFRVKFARDEKRGISSSNLHRRSLAFHLLFFACAAYRISCEINAKSLAIIGVWYAWKRNRGYLGPRMLRKANNEVGDCGCGGGINEG